MADELVLATEQRFVALDHRAPRGGAANCLNLVAIIAGTLRSTGADQNPKRASSAATQISPASSMAKNTAAEPRSFVTLMAVCNSGWT